MKKSKIKSFFEDLEPWKKEWKGMPDFVQEDLEPIQQITVNFKTKEDVQKFAELINRRITNKTRFVWYPNPPKREKYTDKKYVDES